MDNECESLVALADRLVALAEAATAGPWEVDGEWIRITRDQANKYEYIAEVLAGPNDEGSRDAALIVAAVNAIPALAAGIYHLHERAEKAEAVCRSIDDCSYDPIAMAAWREVTG
jgi:hypothetical protein